VINIAKLRSAGVGGPSTAPKSANVGHESSASRRGPITHLPITTHRTPTVLCGSVWNGYAWVPAPAKVHPFWSLFSAAGRGAAAARIFFRSSAQIRSNRHRNSAWPRTATQNLIDG
jgi:hypothetical protein